MTVIAVIALFLLNVVLACIIVRLERELARARTEAAWEHEIAELFQRLAREQQDMAHRWMARATGVEIPQGVPDAFLRGWDDEP